MAPSSGRTATDIHENEQSSGHTMGSLRLGAENEMERTANLEKAKQRARRVLAVAVAVSTAAVGLALPGAPQAHAQDTSEFLLELVPDGGELMLSVAEEPMAIEPPLTLEGLVDPETGEISGGHFQMPPVAGQFELEAMGLLADVDLDARFSELEPGTTTGRIDNDGNLEITATVQVDADVDVAVGGVVIAQATCHGSPIELSFVSADPYDPDSRQVTLVDPDFTIPEVSTEDPCGELIGGAVNDQLAGPGHSLTLVMEGELPIPEDAGEPTTSSLAVLPEGGTFTGRPVTMTATIEPGEDAELGGHPAGEVDFRAGDTLLASAPLVDGVAQHVTADLPPGDHQLTVRYRGDIAWAPSTSDPVMYTVSAGPLVNSSLPEAIQIGGGPVEFTVGVANPEGSGPVENARLDITLERAVGTAAFTPDRVLLERFDGTDWQEVILSADGAPVRTIYGTLDESKGSPLAALGERSEQLRLSFGPEGSPTVSPGPVTVTVEVVEVDAAEGNPAPVVAPAAAAVGGLTSTVTMTEAQRRNTTITLLASLGFPPLPVFSPVIRQGYMFQTGQLSNVGPAVSGVRPTGVVEYHLGEQLVHVGPISTGAASTINHRFPIPTDTPPGEYQLRVVYDGDLIFSPAEVSTPIEVLPAQGIPLACVGSGVVAGTFNTYLDVSASLPVAWPAGSSAPVELPEFSLFTDRSQFAVNIFSSFFGNGLVPVEDGPILSLDVLLGPGGVAHVTTTERIGTVFTPGSTDPDQTLRLVDPEGSVPMTGPLGDAAPVTFEEMRVQAQSLGGGAILTCTPVDGPIHLGEVIAAGTELDVTPGPVTEQIDEVTLEALSYPHEAEGTITFVSNIDGELGTVATEDGAASLVTSELTPGPHRLTAVFDPEDTVTYPQTTSEAVPLQVRSLADPTAVAPPILSGSSVAGSTLTFDPGAWTGTEPVTLSWRWLSCASVGSGCTTLRSGGNSLALSSAHVGRVIQVEVTATNPSGTTVMRTGAIGPVTLRQVAPPPPPPGSGFVDVPPGTYFAAPVSWMVAHGITTGIGGGNTFAPHEPASRAQAITFLHRLAGNPAPSGPHFADVPGNSYFSAPTRWARQAGITTGVGGTNVYEPHRDVTRAEWIALLYRYAGEPGAGGGARFADVPAGSYFDAPTRWARQHGITTGVGGTNAFEPHRNVTRAEIAAFLYRFATTPAAHGTGSQPVLP